MELAEFNGYAPDASVYDVCAVAAYRNATCGEMDDDSIKFGLI